MSSSVHIQPDKQIKYKQESGLFIGEWEWGKDENNIHVGESEICVIEDIFNFTFLSIWIKRKNEERMIFRWE